MCVGITNIALTANVFGYVPTMPVKNLQTDKKTKGGLFNKPPFY